MTLSGAVDRSKMTARRRQYAAAVHASLLFIPYITATESSQVQLAGDIQKADLSFPNVDIYAD